MWATVHTTIIIIIILLAIWTRIESDSLNLATIPNCLRLNVQAQTKTSIEKTMCHPTLCYHQQPQPLYHPPNYRPIRARALHRVTNCRITRTILICRATMPKQIDRLLDWRMQARSTWTSIDLRETYRTLIRIEWQTVTTVVTSTVRITYFLAPPRGCRPIVSIHAALSVFTKKFSTFITIFCRRKLKSKRAKMWYND